jgi:hypothetical protein
VVLGSIEGFHNLFTYRRKIKEKAKQKKTHSFTFTPERRGKYQLHLAVIVVLICVLSAAFFEPYGPLNDRSPDNFNLGGILHESTIQYYEMQHILSLIPENDPYVVFQNVFPEMGFHDFGNNPIPTNYVINHNMTIFEGATQTYEPLFKIDYVLVTTYYDSSDFWGPPAHLTISASSR